MKKIMIAFLLMGAGAAFSQSPGELLQTKLNSIRTMTANFQQTVKAKHRMVSRSSGTMALQRPGHFRWQTRSPMAQVMIADGQKIWVYDKELEQVSVKKQQKGIGGTAALFLSGYNNTVSRDFKVTQSGSGNDVTFDLRAKSSKGGFQHIKLRFNQNTLTGLELYDQLGQTTSVHLSQVKINPKLSAALFQFKAPKGVDVVRQ